MAYFANSSDSNAFETKWCSNCVHCGTSVSRDVGDHDSCAVMLAHAVYNYDDSDKPNSILHMLIPRDYKGQNKQCRMFIQRPAPKFLDGQKELF